MKNKKPRKRKRSYVPTYTLHDLLNASNTKPLSKERQEHHLKPSRAAIESIKSGEMTRQNWCDCCFILNLMWQLLKMSGYEDETGLLDSAMNAMDASKSRMIKGEALALSADELDDVASIVNQYAELIKTVSERDMVRLYIATEAEIDKANKREGQKCKSPD